MDLDLGPEHVLLRDTVRDFMRTEVGSSSTSMSRAPLPVEIVKRIGELGWLGHPEPGGRRRRRGSTPSPMRSRSRR